MAVQVRCPNCGKVLTHSGSLAGSVVRCPVCEQPFAVRPAPMGEIPPLPPQPQVPEETLTENDKDYWLVDAIRKGLVTPDHTSPLLNLMERLGARNRFTRTPAAKRDVLASQTRGETDKTFFEKEAEKYRAALLVNPNNALALGGLGMAYNGLGRKTEAIELLESAIRLKPDYWEACAGLGGAYMAVGRVAEAVELFQKSIHLKPDYPEAHRFLALAYGDLGRLEEAIASLKTAVRLKPDYTVAHRELGMTYGELGLYDEAVVAFGDSLRWDPRSAETYRCLVSLYLRTKNTIGARRCYEALMRLDWEKAAEFAPYFGGDLSGPWGDKGGGVY
jgi:tetratricopeptide (TPR) repeat protein